MPALVVSIASHPNTAQTMHAWPILELSSALNAIAHVCACSRVSRYVDLGLTDWAKIKAICRAVQPNAQ